MQITYRELNSMDEGRRYDLTLCGKCRWMAKVIQVCAEHMNKK